jgi:hypothetical protein
LAKAILEITHPVGNSIDIGKHFEIFTFASKEQEIKAEQLEQIQLPTRL